MATQAVGRFGEEIDDDEVDPVAAPLLRSTVVAPRPGANFKRADVRNPRYSAARVGGAQSCNFGAAPALLNPMRLGAGLGPP